MKKQENNIVENKIRELLVDYEPDFNLEDWIKMKEKLGSLPKNQRKTRVINFFRYAAAIFILGFILVIAWNRLKPLKMITQITEQEKMEIKLADDTHVWLNRNTEFTYPKKFRGRKREVFLNGEAYFEVTKDSLKGFIVNTSLSKIKVVGTKFNIESFEEDNTEIISVTEGKVLVNSNENNINILLTRGESFSLNMIDNNFQKGQIDNLNLLSWKTNKIQFINTPLDKVATTLSKHYNENIIIDDNQLKDIKLTATFNNEPLNEVLEIIVLTLNVELRNEENQIRLMLSN